MKKIKNATKRLLCTLMMLTLIFQLVPAVTFAADADPLKPESVTQDGIATLSKTAVRVGPDEWEITLTVDALQTLYTKPLELVMLIDTSGSMARCAKEEHTHTLACKRDGCEKDEHRHSTWMNRPCKDMEETDCRQYIAGTALQNFVKGLNDSQISSSVAVCTFGNSGYTKLERTSLNDDTVDEICNAIPTNSPEKSELTNLYKGLWNARKEFSDSKDTLKVLLILCDGEYTGVLPVVTAAEMREEGVIIDSIGFMYHSTAVSQIATENHYQYANDGVDLEVILEDYLDNLLSMVTDTMGSKVSLSELVSYSNFLEPVITDSTLTWHPETGNIPTGEQVKIVYRTKLNPEEIVAGVYDIPLNEEAKIVYYTEGSSDLDELAFPVPYAHYEVGTLTVSYEGLPEGIAPATQVITKITDYEKTEFEFAPVASKTITAPDGTVYVYRGSVYTDEEGVEHVVDGLTTDSLEAVAGQHTLVHKYTVNKDYVVSYIYAGAIPFAADPLPIPTVYAEGTADIAVAPDPTPVPGYTFTGWKTVNVAVSADNTFDMPASNVCFVGTWVLNPKPIVYPVSYVYDFTAPAGAPLPPETKFYDWGERVDVEPRPEYEGYVFVGWIPTTVLAWTGVGEFAMPNWHVVFVGSWRKCCCPDDTTTPEIDTTTPEEDTTTPEEDTTTPEEDITTPVEDTTTPEEDITTPVEDTTTPEEDTTTPVEDTTTPEEDTTTPEEDTTTPEEDTTTPEEDTTTPEEEVTTPEEDTTTPEEEVTTPEEETTPDEEITTVPETEPDPEIPDTEEPENPKTSGAWITAAILALCASFTIFMVANKKRAK